MFQWARILGIHPRPAIPQSEPAVDLLAITADDGFYATLRDIAETRNWRIQRADTVENAAASLSPDLVILDSDGEEWQTAVGRLASLPNRPCVLLASPVVDENLREEVIRSRGYDVFARSADRDQIVRSIQFAWFWAKRGVKH